MTIGVIGLGSIGERHIRNIAKHYPRASIEVLTKRKTWAESPGNVRLISSPATFYKTTHDVYFVTNETVRHVETVKKVLVQKPKGIFIEKPVSHTLTGLTEIQRQAQKQGTVVCVGYNLQFFKPLQKLKELITKKSIGEVKSMRVSVGQDLRTWRKGDYRKSYSADSKKGGGVVLDLIHDLNYPAWLLDTELSFVSGAVGTKTLSIKSEDVAESIFVTPRGVVVSVHQDYVQIPGRRYCEVIGTKGRLLWEWSLGESSTIRIVTLSKQRTLSIREDRNRMYEQEVSWFMKKVTGGKGWSNLDEGIRDVAHAEQIKKHTV